MNFEALIPIARAAGREILDVYKTDFAVETKADSSPLTEADLRAHRVILKGLAEHWPGVPVLSEENVEEFPFEKRRNWRRFWLVDPLDGTKEFIKRNGQFTVNIAWIEDGRPTAGVVFAPDLDWLYYAAPGERAVKIEAGGPPIGLGPPRTPEPGKLVVVGSRSHPTPEMDAYLTRLRAAGDEIEFVAMGSSLKLCILAENRADVYPRLGPTMEWDTAAAHAVARAAGRAVTAYDSDDEMTYNKADLRNPWFIAR